VLRISKNQQASVNLTEKSDVLYLFFQLESPMEVEFGQEESLPIENDGYSDKTLLQSNQPEREQ
jgi:hypothetical protein